MQDLTPYGSCTMSLFLGLEIPSELKTVVHTTLDGTTKIIGAVSETNLVPAPVEFTVNFASAIWNVSTAHYICELACSAKNSLGSYK